MAEIHLICNAHIDPVWQWEWEEGAAAAVSTFRAAADFCEEFDNFVFCHNEALLYRWVEEYEPELFERIHRLVISGKWKIMGGWYLQPDCNMPDGESIIRQIKLGHDYFLEKFGVSCKTAVSFDAFGHDCGLTQILKRAGYESYLFMRPGGDVFDYPKDDFIWVGRDGSEILAHHLDVGYNTPLGRACESLQQWINFHPDVEIGLVPWGVGNHGGGPSRKDIRDLNEYASMHIDNGIRHSTPELYFDKIGQQRADLPRVAASLRPHSVGCYTSQVRVKQCHREMEAALDMTQRIMTEASLRGLCSYAYEDIQEMERDLCMSEFHDILPGSSIQDVEATSLRVLNHGLEIAARLKARAFYALAKNEPKADQGIIPVLVYNPHPYPVKAEIAAEFMLADQNRKKEFTDISVWQNGCHIPSQVEKERSNLPIDWRKRIVFAAELMPMSMNRFDCKTNVLPEKKAPEQVFSLDNGEISVRINKDTGLLDSYIRDGVEYLERPACRLLVIKDSEDPWGMTVVEFPDVIGEFKIMTPEESARFAGVFGDTLAPVRVIEDGDVRKVVEACFKWNESYALVTYKIPKIGFGIDIDVRLIFNEKDKMVKLSVPGNITGKCIGQGMFCWEELNNSGKENVAQKWVAATNGEKMLTVANKGTYGSSFADGELRLTLLRSAGYTAHPIDDRIILPQDRFSPRMDQGERVFCFELCGGSAEERIENISREALIFNEPPYALSFFPNGVKKDATPIIMLIGKGADITNIHMDRDGNPIVRIVNALDHQNDVTLDAPIIQSSVDVCMNAFEALTFKMDMQKRQINQCGILE